ncbi:hypothetical protein HK098_008227 [Nowakowskiella sp. JEL0407]|nr:hypothetical protein HK098_008227 [Nowakowskiella sp. JEL0407]
MNIAERDQRLSAARKKLKNFQKKKTDQEFLSTATNSPRLSTISVGPAPAATGWETNSNYIGSNLSSPRTSSVDVPPSSTSPLYRSQSRTQLRPQQLQKINPNIDERRNSAGSLIELSPTSTLFELMAKQEADLKQLRQQYDMQTQMTSVLYSEKSSLQSTLESLTIQNQSLQQQLDQFHTVSNNLQNLEHEHAQISERLQSLLEQNDKLNQNVIEKNASFDEIRRVKSSLEQFNQEYLTKIQELNLRIEQQSVELQSAEILRNTIAEKDQLLLELQSEISQYQSRTDQVNREQLDELGSQLSESQGLIAAVQSELESSRLQIESLRSANQDLSSTFDNLKLEYEKQFAERQRLEKEISHSTTKDAKILELERKIAELTEIVESQNVDKQIAQQVFENSLNEREQRFAEELNILKSQSQKYNEDNQRLLQQLTRAEEEFSAKLSENEAMLSRNASEVTSQVSHLHEENVRLSQLLRETQQQLQAQMEINEENEQLQQDFHAITSIKDDRISELEGLVQESERVLKIVESERDTLTRDFEMKLDDSRNSSGEQLEEALSKSAALYEENSRLMQQLNLTEQELQRVLENSEADERLIKEIHDLKAEKDARILELEDMVGELRKQLEIVEGEKTSIAEGKLLAEEENQYFNEECERMSLRVASLEGEITTLNSRINEMEAECDRLGAIITEKGQLIEYNYGELQRSREELDRQVSKANAELEQTKLQLQQATELSASTSATSHQLQLLSENYSILDAEKTELEQENGVLREQISALNGEIELLRGELELQRQRDVEIEQETQQLRDTNYRVGTELQNAVQEKQELVNELRAVKEEAEKSLNEYTSMKESNASLVEMERSNASALETSLRTRMNELESEIEVLELEVESAREENSRLANDMSELKAKNERLLGESSSAIRELETKRGLSVEVVSDLQLRLTSLESINQQLQIDLETQKTERLKIVQEYQTQIEDYQNNFSSQEKLSYEMDDLRERLKEYEEWEQEMSLESMKEQDKRKGLEEQVRNLNAKIGELEFKKLELDVLIEELQFKLSIQTKKEIGEVEVQTEDVTIDVRKRSEVELSVSDLSPLTKRDIIEGLHLDNERIMNKLREVEVQREELLALLAEEKHKNNLLTAEVDALPDYIELYHQERKALFAQVQRLIQRARTTESRRNSMDTSELAHFLDTLTPSQRPSLQLERTTSQEEPDKSFTELKSPMSPPQPSVTSRNSLEEPIARKSAAESIVAAYKGVETGVVQGGMLLNGVVDDFLPCRNCEGQIIIL